MQNITLDCGVNGRLEFTVDSGMTNIRLVSHLKRDTCETCGNEWCCNPDHGEQPDPANADDLGHHVCVDRIRYNGALDGLESFLLTQMAQYREIPTFLKLIVETTLDHLENNIYG